VRSVTVQKSDGQVGVNPEVYFKEDGAEILKIAKVYKGTAAAACGVVNQGDRIVSINGVPLTSNGVAGSILTQASEELAQSADGVNITLDLESDMLMAGWMQKKGEKGLLKTWQKRFFTLIWSEFNMAEREIRYYEGQDYSTRKLKGAIDLTRFSAVDQVVIEGGAGITITTPGRVWELLPETASQAADWYKLLTTLLSRTLGFAVVSTMSNLALEEALDDEDAFTAAKPKQGELTVTLTRKLGMSICKMGQDIVIAQIEPDGAAAACGLLAPGDAVLAVNGSEAISCKQTIKLLTEHTNAIQLTLCTKVVHGGWMHKLGEGLGGWTTRYFTLAYELEMTTAQAYAVAQKSTRERATSVSERKKTRQRATSSAAVDSSSAFQVRLHKPTKTDKLGLGLIEDEEGRVTIEKIYPDYVAANSGSLMVGDVLLEVNGTRCTDQQQALGVLLEASGAVEIKVERTADPGCWVLRYYEGKNSASRVEKGVIRLSKNTVNEINKYTLQEEDTADNVPRVGLYILQDERCWELLPPEEELDGWVSSLQLAVFGEEVISQEYCSKAGASAARAKVQSLKGARTLTLQQQYGLVLATFDSPPEGALPAPDLPAGTTAVYVMNFEMDGAGACNGLLHHNDRILEVNGVPAANLKQVTGTFKSSTHSVKVKVSSLVVHGGFLAKKGELNQTFQLRFFLLIDAPDSAVLQYYEGRNIVTRKFKGEIRINPKEVTSVRQFIYDNPTTGEKTPGVLIETPSRKWELLCERTNEARLWVALLHERVRPKRLAAQQVHQEESRARERGKSISVHANAGAAAVPSKPPAAIPESTRL